ncbi:MAG: HDIG domain-containing metalloprotein [Planctomycetota bacterium]
MSTPKASPARRRELRRPVPRRRSPWREALRDRSLFWAAAFATILTVVGAVVAGFGQSSDRHFPGQILGEPAFARVDFSLVNPSEVDFEKQRARRAQPEVYAANRDLAQRLRLTLNEAGELAFLDDATAAERFGVYGFDPAARVAVARLYGADGNPSEWTARVDAFLKELFQVYILPEGDLARLRGDAPSPPPIEVIPLDAPAGAEQRLTVQLSACIEVGDLTRIRDELGFATLNLPSGTQEFVTQLVIAQLTRPLYLPDTANTRALRAAAAAAVEVRPSQHDRGELLAEALVPLTPVEVRLLDEERLAFQNARPQLARLVDRGGLFASMALVAVGLWVYVVSYAPRIRRNPMRGAALTGLLLLCQLAAVLAAAIWPSFTYGAATFPVLLASMTLAIAYDQRFAIAVGALLVLMLMLTLALPATTALVMLVGVAAAAVQLREVRRRSKIVIVGLVCAAAMSLAALAVAPLERPLVGSGARPQLEILLDLGVNVLAPIAASAFATGLFVQGMLPVVERAFNITTAMTLKELNDASHPLLQQLAQDAPGTYRHSLAIADIAESAAEAIGADGLLCRVGAMYHDIGKMNKPDYFIENQGGGPNRHRNLSPAMSLLIIVGHVKDGAEMAREFGLPPVLRHFIESHHGTTLVEYFFHAAKKQTQEQDRPDPSEFEFRYPGPKPEFKEAGILLLCDGIEAAARALDDPTPIRLEQLVHSIATKRLLDGQFDACDLTLRDLARVEKAVTKTLCSIYHSRIKYPAGNEAGKANGKSTVAPGAAGTAPRSTVSA